MEDFVSQPMQPLLWGAREIVDRFSGILVTTVQKEAGSVQVLLDLYKAEHFANRFVMEDHFVTALAVEVADTIALPLL